MQDHIQHHDPCAAVWMRQILFAELMPFDHHAVRAEDVVTDMELAVIRLLHVHDLLQSDTPDLFQHHHSYETSQLKRLILLRITLYITDDHEAQRMLTERNADDRPGIQPLICLIFLRIRFPDRLNVRDDQWLLIHQVLYPCRELFCELHFVEQRFLHRTETDFIPDFRYEYLRLKISCQNPAPVGIVQFTGCFHDADCNLQGIFFVMKRGLCLKNNLEQKILKLITQHVLFGNFSEIPGPFFC